MTIPIALFAAEHGSFNPLDLSAGGGIFWTCVIFLVALIPIWKFVMGPITKALAERDDKAAAAIVAAEKAARDAESSRAAVDAKLKEAHAEAVKLLDAARSRGEAVERQIKDDASKAATAMIERAKSEIKNEEAKALSAIRREVVEVSLSAAGQVLRRKVDAADDRRLVEEMVAVSSKEART